VFVLDCVPDYLVDNHELTSTIEYYKVIKCCENSIVRGLLRIFIGLWGSVKDAVNG
jgi:hypothetical protein